MAKNKLILEDFQKPYISTSDLANFLGVSRVAVFKKIKLGQIKAEKIGRNYLIPREELLSIAGKFVSEKRRREIDKTVEKIVNKYGKALRRLGKE